MSNDKFSDMSEKMNEFAGKSKQFYNEQWTISDLQQLTSSKWRDASQHQ